MYTRGKGWGVVEQSGVHNVRVSVMSALVQRLHALSQTGRQSRTDNGKICTGSVWHFCFTLAVVQQGSRSVCRTCNMQHRTRLFNWNIQEFINTVVLLLRDATHCTVLRNQCMQVESAPASFGWGGRLPELVDSFGTVLL